MNPYDQQETRPFLTGVHHTGTLTLDRLTDNKDAFQRACLAAKEFADPLQIVALAGDRVRTIPSSDGHDITDYLNEALKGTGVDPLTLYLRRFNVPQDLPGHIRAQFDEVEDWTIQKCMADCDHVWFTKSGDPDTVKVLLDRFFSSEAHQYGMLVDMVCVHFFRLTTGGDLAVFQANVDDL
jgi:hypothetical protein